MFNAQYGNLRSAELSLCLLLALILNSESIYVNPNLKLGTVLCVFVGFLYDISIFMQIVNRCVKYYNLKMLS